MNCPCCGEPGRDFGGRININHYPMFLCDPCPCPKGEHFFSADPDPQFQWWKRREPEKKKKPNKPKKKTTEPIVKRISRKPKDTLSGNLFS